MMRHLVVCAALFCAFQLSAHAGALLPSQEEHDLVTVKTCRDHEVLSSLKAAIDSSLQASSVLARGMRAGDVHLEAFGSTGLPSFAPLQLLPRESANGSSIRWPWRDRPTSSNSAANPEEVNYFRTNLRSGQSIWMCRPGALDRLRPVPSDALIQPPRLATIYSTDNYAPCQRGRIPHSRRPFSLPIANRRLATIACRTGHPIHQTTARTPADGRPAGAFSV